MSTCGHRADPLPWPCVALGAEPRPHGCGAGQAGLWAASPGLGLRAEFVRAPGGKPLLRSVFELLLIQCSWRTALPWFPVHSTRVRHRCALQSHRRPGPGDRLPPAEVLFPGGRCPLPPARPTPGAPHLRPPSSCSLSQGVCSEKTGAVMERGQTVIYKSPVSKSPGM